MEWCRRCGTQHAISARWGITKPTHEAGTGNLSESGLFLVTPTPPEPGATIRLLLRLESCTVPLKGRVVWTRQEEDADLPRGMGVHLVRPPSIYVHFVSQLA